MNKLHTPFFIMRLLVILSSVFFTMPVFSATVSATDSGLITNSDISIPKQKTVHQREVSRPAVDVYNKLFNALENNAYFVINEPDFGRTLARFSQRWGKDYNINKIESYRSLVFCNAWYANSITNADPAMALICPQHITVIQIKNKTQILYSLPTITSQNSPAQSIVKSMEDEIVLIINEVAR